MQTISTIGLDIAKSVFQVHGVDANGLVVIRRQLKRRYVLAFFEKLPTCLIGIEACASSHRWSRQLQALGHTVRLMPPAYVKPYVKRQKNDMADAEAICEAVTRANMRFVPTKTPEQQSGLMLLRTRHLLIRQQTSVINAIRAHLAEFGVIAPVGRRCTIQIFVCKCGKVERSVLANGCVRGASMRLGRLSIKMPATPVYSGKNHSSSSVPEPTPSLREITRSCQSRILRDSPSSCNSAAKRSGGDSGPRAPAYASSQGPSAMNSRCDLLVRASVSPLRR